MANEQDVADILASARSIAVVGASADPSRDSHRAVSYLLAAGFEVTAVNPKVNEVLGQKSYASLLEVATQIDTVVCFRRKRNLADCPTGDINRRTKSLDATGGGQPGSAGFSRGSRPSGRDEPMHHGRPRARPV